MKKTKKELEVVSLKNERGIGAIIGFGILIVAAIILAIVFVVLPAVHDYECRDCDDVWAQPGDFRRITEYGTEVKVFGDEEGVIVIRHNEQAVNRDYWELDFYDYRTEDGWHFQTITYDSLSEMKSDIDNMTIPGDQEEGFQHIIDCVKRGCPSYG